MFGRVSRQSRSMVRLFKEEYGSDYHWREGPFSRESANSFANIFRFSYILFALFHSGKREAHAQTVD
jgi:hypothetical protein